MANICNFLQTKEKRTMKTVFDESQKRFSQMDWEAQAAVRDAISKTANCDGFKVGSEVWRNCTLKITCGHNIYTTSINIYPTDKALNAHSERWNQSAYYCNGCFWGSASRMEVSLI